MKHIKHAQRFDTVIEVLVEKASTDNWFNKMYDLDLSRSDLTELLRVATKHQLFQFNGNLYEQIDGVAMGSPLGPLMANAFLCAMEEKFENENKLPKFYKRYIDDTLAMVRDIPSTTKFLTILNNWR